MMRAFLAAGILAAALAVPARAETTKVIADGRGATGLSAYGGHLVYSVRDPVSKQWSLVRWHAGHVEALPVPPRSVPFDADAGPDAAGHPVVVYSACTRAAAPRDATAARGCHIMQLRLDRPSRPVPVAGTNRPGVSLTTPSRWRGDLAYARRADGSELSQVVLRHKGTTRRLRQPAILCDLDCDDRDVAITIEAIDLGARAAAFLWRQDGADTYGIASVWSLIVDPLSGGRMRDLSDGYVDGACGYVLPFAPTVIGAGAFWVAAGSPCDRTQTDFAQELLRPRRFREAKERSGPIFGATRDGDTVYWLRPAKLRSTDQLGYSDLCADPQRRCQIVRSRQLPWHTLKKGKQPGPQPEDE